VGKTVHTSYAYAGNDYDDLEWCANNPEDQDVEEYSPEYFDNLDEQYVEERAGGALASWSAGHQYGILDGGATSTVASFELIQLIADAWEPLDRYPDLEDNGGKAFLFAGGEQSSSKVRAWMPNELFEDGIAVNVVPCTSTPILIGLDMLRYYGLVLDYAHDTVYSHRLKRSIPCTVLKSGHLGLSMMPEESDD